jgi:hypothetical protein
MTAASAIHARLSRISKLMGARRGKLTGPNHNSAMNESVSHRATNAPGEGVGASLGLHRMTLATDEPGMGAHVFGVNWWLRERRKILKSQNHRGQAIRSRRPSYLGRHHAHSPFNSRRPDCRPCNKRTVVHYFRARGHYELV